ncbi:MAG: hypothetical protein EP330_19490 [Deltaproteobacteria bacterium]|nr:MAG: hypothetical protein EP330_19490 [Deltaproteobacteria bacterium]
MSRCNLAIEMMDPGAPRRPGDQVQGFVTVDVDKSVNCRGLHIVLRCMTRGRGNTWRQDVVDQVVYEGEWKPGDNLVYPFEFDVPNGPVTYHGKLLNVVWQVYTYVDIPWGFDPESEYEFEVVRGEARPSLGPSQQAMPNLPIAITSPSKVPLIAMLAIVPLFLGLPMAVVALDGEPFLAFCAAASVMVFAVVGGIAFVAMRNRIAERKLGPVDVQLSATELDIGDELTVTVRLSPEQAVAIRGASVHLHAGEVVTRGSGTNRTTYREELLSERIAVAEAGEVRGETTWTARFRIPEGAPSSFSASDNHLAWNLTFQVDIPRWPDFVSTTPLSVFPATR